MIEKNELMKSRQIKLKRNARTESEKSYSEEDIDDKDSGWRFGDEKDIKSREFDDELNDDKYQSKRERKDNLYKKVLAELEDMMEQRDHGYNKEKRGRDAAQELLDEINRALGNN
jgi:hypothetical protein